MAKDFAAGFYNSKKWKQARNTFVAERVMIDGGMCQCSGCNSLGYIVHHKIVLTPANINNVDIALGKDNLMYVCKDCHDKIHYREIHGRDPEPRRTMFGPNGEVIPVSPLQNDRV